MMWLSPLSLGLVQAVLSLPLQLSSEGLAVGLEDVFISVKTTSKFHHTRLGPVLDTWYRLAPDSTWIFTDSDDHEVEERVSPGHLVTTSCPSDHSRQYKFILRFIY